MDVEGVKSEIIEALCHVEAEEGLYLRNFLLVHHEDSRPRVHASQEQLLDALTELIVEGAVRITESQEQVVFQLSH